MSEDYSYLAIQTVPNVNSFTLTVADSGDTSGTEGAYIPAFDISALTDTALTIEAPAAGNAQLLGISHFIDNMEDTSITVTTPSNAIDNGAGKNNSISTRNVPTLDCYNVDGTNSSKINNASVTFVVASGHNVFTLSGGLDIFGDILYQLRF